MTQIGATIFGCAGLTLRPEERSFFAHAQPWGFILFARNVDTPAQLSALTRDLRDAVGRNVPIFIDQEGGRVARLRAPHWREWLPALDQVNENKRDALRGLYLRYRLIAHELHAVGIDGNCAPLADIASVDTHPVLFNRCYGEDVLRVAEHAATVAQTLLEGGVLPVVKHIPGQGRAKKDSETRSHLEIARVGAKEKDLARSDFMAFEPLAGLPMAMSAHVVYEDIDPNWPGTQSSAVISMIRERIGFKGLLMTDDISMEALDGALQLRCDRALLAGCDVILHCNGILEQMHEVADASGKLEAVSLERANKALSWRRSPDAVDIQALDDEFQNLMTGQMLDDTQNERNKGL